MLNSVSTGHFGRWEANHAALCLDLLLKKRVIIPVQVIEFLLVSLLLWVVDREELHEVVSRVSELGHGSINLLEVLDGLLGVTLVYNVTVGHENELIEVEKGLGGGRVDRAHDSFTLGTSEPLQKHANAQSLE